MCRLKNHYGVELQNKVLVLGRGFYEHPRSKMTWSSKNHGTSISCSIDNEKDTFALPSNVELSEAHILYCAAPAMGHNQVY